MFSCMYNYYFLHSLVLCVCMVCLVICMIFVATVQTRGSSYGFWFCIYFASGRSCGENRFFCRAGLME